MAISLHRRTEKAFMTMVALVGCAVLAGCGGANETDLFGIPPVGIDASADVGSSDATPDRRDTGPDVVVPPSSPIILCGPPLNNPKAKCDATKKEFCCRRGDTEPFDYGCETDETNCADFNDVRIGCSSTATCAGLGLTGTVCCGTLVASGGTGSVITGTECTTPANCLSGGSVGKAVVCDPSAPNNCPNGGSCKLSTQTMPGYNLCIGGN